MEIMAYPRNCNIILSPCLRIDYCFKDDGDGKQFIVDVITIVRHQNSEVLFEGVETLEQLEFLREYDCDTIQGFYFDEPLPHDVFQKRLLNPKY